MLSTKRSRIILFVVLAVVAGLTVYRSYIIGKEIEVVSSSPSDNQTEIPVKSSIYVSFNRGLSKKEQTEIKITFEPQTEYTLLWVNNRQLMVSPEASLAHNTSYSYIVNMSSSKLFNSSFKTVEFPKELDPSLVSPSDKEDQREGDLAFNDGMNAFLEQYPFYTQLPIEQPEYRIVYDLEQDKFRIRMKVPSYADQAVKDRILRDAINSLRKIGVEVGGDYYVLYTE
jgi:hypothetical protein